MPIWRDYDKLSAWVTHDRLGIITDVDGTISPIADTPDAARVTPGAKNLLAQMANTFPLVGVISGRGAADVQARVGVAGVIYVGNHGLERWVDNQVETPPHVAEYRPAVEAARDAIRARLEDDPGTRMEDKGATLSVHYRQAPDPAAAQERLRPIVNAISEEHGLRVFEGRMIFEVRPPLDMNKGSAFEALVREFKLDAAVYLGDDTTDIDAIKAARRLREAGVCDAIGLGVNSAETPPAVLEAADATIDGIEGVEEFFGWLLAQKS